MKNIYITLIILFTLFQCSVAFAQFLNPFTASEEGWTAATLGAGTAPSAAWSATNGNPNGCFKGTDNANTTWYYYSSAVYNTDLSAHYTDFLSFDLKQNTTVSQTNDADVIICKADGSQIVFNTALNPGTSWTNYIVPLSETGWRHSTTAGALVTYSEMISFLSAVYFIKIRGDYSSLSTETDWLDNVSIVSGIFLPITLVNFEGQQVSNSVVDLTWETNSEADVDFYQIEKSIDNGITFDSIGSISATGILSNVNTYKFSDTQFNTDAYYRLKSTNLIEAPGYSNIILVARTGQAGAVVLYPNPATLQVTVVYTAESNQTVPFLICDSNLSVIYSGIFSGTAGSESIDVSKTTSGMYFLIMPSENEVQSYPFQVIH